MKKKARNVPERSKKRPAENTADPSQLTPRLRAILAVVIIADLLDLMDSTITNIAAPTIVESIGGGEPLMKWLGASYALAIGVLLVIGGRLGDRYGKRRLFLIGIIGFTAASTLCGLSFSPAMIIAGRLIQGGFGALLIPQGMSILVNTFSREQLPRAFSAFGPVMSISSVLGPIFAGLIIVANIGGLRWRPMFLINILLGLTGLVAAVRLLPRDQPNKEERLDILGSILLALTMLCLIYGLIQGPADGWGMIPIMSLAAGIIFFAAFMLRQRLASNPLIKPSLLKNKGFTSGLLIGLVFFVAVSGLSYVLSLFFQLELRLNPAQAALLLSPMAIGIVISSLVCRPLLEKLGRRITILGLLTTLAGVIALFLTIQLKGAVASPLMTAPAILVVGLGMGGCLSSIFEVALGDLASDETGSASGSLSAVQQLAGAFGSAVVTTVYFSRSNAGDGPGAMTVSLLVVAGMVALCLGLVWLLPDKAPAEGK